MKKVVFMQKLAILILIGGGAIVMWFLETGCLIQRYIGIPCMSCGMTRAFFAFINGDFAQSFELHPMLLSVPVLALIFLFGDKLFKSKAKIPAIILLILIIFGFVVNYILKLKALYF